MKAILVNYNFDPSWILNYPELEVRLYDRTDTGIHLDLTQYGEVYLTNNVGDVDYDKLSYLVENYDTLPDVFLWGKSNIFKFVEEGDLQKALQNNAFSPLLKFDHRVYDDHFGQVNFYRGPMYYERADSWFFNTVPAKHFRNWDDWCVHFGLPREAFIPFAPGGNYILTKERVHRYSRDFYDDMRSTLPHAQRPAEAHACERSYFYLWR
jgi:hypothetical protein